MNEIIRRRYTVSGELKRIAAELSAQAHECTKKRKQMPDCALRKIYFDREKSLRIASSIITVIVPLVAILREVAEMEDENGMD